LIIIPQHATKCKCFFIFFIFLITREKSAGKARFFYQRLVPARAAERRTPPNSTPKILLPTQSDYLFIDYTPPYLACCGTRRRFPVIRRYSK